MAVSIGERIKDLWDLDFDTMEISEIIKEPEWKIYRILSAIRKERYAVKGKDSARDRNQD